MDIYSIRRIESIYKPLHAHLIRPILFQYSVYILFYPILNIHRSFYFLMRKLCVTLFPFAFVLFLFILKPISVHALEDLVIPDPITTIFRPKKKKSDTVTITVKYKESTLKESDEMKKGKEAEQKIKDIVKESYPITEAVQFTIPTEEKVKENKKKFPKRAQRAPLNAPIPNLSLIKKMTVPNNQAEEVIQKLQKDAQVEYAIREEEAIPTAPDDPYYIVTHNVFGYTYLNSWNLRQVNLGPTGSGTSGWDTETGDPSTVVAVYGTGLDYTHPDLENNVWINPGEFPSSSFSGLDANSDTIITLTELKTWSLHPLADYNGDTRIDLADLMTAHVDNIFLNGIDNDSNGYTDDILGWNFSDNSNDVYDDGSSYSGHDTLMASIIGAEGNNGIGMTGMNWHVRIMPIKASMAVGQSIQYAANNGADVLNISYVGAGEGMQDYVNYAYANGMIVVYSSANSQEVFDSYEVHRSDHTWIVSATTQADAFVGSSGRGTRIDFSAPGDMDAGYYPQDVITGMQKRSLRFLTKDKNGNPAFVFFDTVYDVLRYGIKSGGTWSFEDIDSSGIVNGIYPSLAFDSSNNPHVSYYDWENRKLKYATKSSGSWSTQTLTDTDDQGYGTSIVVDGSNHPRIAYTDCTNSLIKMKNYNGSSWDDDTVGTSGTASDCLYSHISLALDTAGDPNLSFFNLTDSDLMFAVKKSGTWTIETVDATGTAGRYNYMALDSSDRPHIAYQGSGSKPKYAMKDGTWSTQFLVQDHSTLSSANTIALDASGYPHVFTTNYDILGDGSYEIIHFYSDGTTFQSEVVGTSTEQFADAQIIMIDGSTKPFGIAKSYYKGLYEVDKSTGSWVYSKILPFDSASYSGMSYTSPAAAMVSGLAALVISAHPTWTIDQVYWAIATSAHDLGDAGHDRYFGWGRIDADAALKVTTPLVDTTNPTATVSAPINGAQVERGSITVTGTATDTNFTRYNLLYKLDSATDYTSVSFYNHTAVTGGTLATWDTSALSYGKYDLRLEVSDWYQTTTYDEEFYLGIDTTAPVISITSISSTDDTTPTITGLATDDLRVVSSVDFQMDGTAGSWTACTAIDGAFEEVGEYFSCSVSNALSSGSHTIYIRATDSQGNISTGASIASMTFTVEGPTPTPTPAPTSIVTSPATPTPTSTSSSSSSSTSSSTSQSPEANIPPGDNPPNIYSAVPIDAHSITLFFSDGEDPIDRYVLEYGTTPGEYPYVISPIGGKGTQIYTVGSLLPNTTYYFHIRGGHGSGVGPWSDVLSATTKDLISFYQLDITHTDLVALEATNEVLSSFSCQPYTVKSGDTLWVIAEELLGNGKKYKDIIEGNKLTYPSLNSSTTLRVGWELSIPCSSSNQSISETREGYELNVRVVDAASQPVEGAKITLHSAIQEGITDKDGIARFTNVEKGNHTVLIAYQKAKGEQSIDLTGDIKKFDLNITAELDPLSVSPWIWMAIGGIGGAIVMMGISLIKERRIPSMTVSHKE